MSDFTIEREGERVDVRLGNKLTAVDVPALQSALKSRIDSGAREIVFDFDSVETLDSSGIGILVAANNSLAAVQGGIRLQRVSADLMKLLRSMRLADRLRATAKD